jgi:hypothetical protein
VRQLPLLLLTAVVSAQTGRLPSFDEYKVSEVYNGKPAAPKLTTFLAREYRAQIKDAAEKGLNFAGKYAIAQWGCGSSCIQMVVIDEQTGDVYRGPFLTLNFVPGLFFADGSRSSSDDFEPLAFRKDSRLLAVRGCPEEEMNRCAEFYYEWDKRRFRLLQKFTPAPPVVP